VNLVYFFYKSILAAVILAKPMTIRHLEKD